MLSIRNSPVDDVMVPETNDESLIFFNATVVNSNGADVDASTTLPLMENIGCWAIETTEKRMKAERTVKDFGAIIRV